MRKGVLYLLMSIFLLFVVENNHRFDFQNIENQIKTSYTTIFAQKGFTSNSIHKSNPQGFTADSLDFSEELNPDDYSFSGFPELSFAIGLLSLFNLALWYFLFKKKNLHPKENIAFSVKKFIFLRNIRI